MGSYEMRLSDHETCMVYMGSHKMSKHKREFGKGEKKRKLVLFGQPVVD